MTEGLPPLTPPLEAAPLYLCDQMAVLQCEVGGHEPPLTVSSYLYLSPCPPTSVPYLCLQMAGLQREVGAHEPASALDGGEGEGLDSLRAVCGGATRALMPGGFLALEVS